MLWERSDQLEWKNFIPIFIRLERITLHDWEKELISLQQSANRINNFLLEKLTTELMKYESVECGGGWAGCTLLCGVLASSRHIRSTASRLALQSCRCAMAPSFMWRLCTNMSSKHDFHKCRSRIKRLHPSNFCNPARLPLSAQTSSVFR